MLIIGHRGAADLAPENSLEAFERGVEAGADLLEFDVQLTRDGVPVVIHDSTLLRTHKSKAKVKKSDHKSLQDAAAKGHRIATLEEVLDLYFGKILLNLEIKNRGTATAITNFIKDRYIKKPDDWHYILFSSFKVSELFAVRHITEEAPLGLLHNRNPFTFIAYQRRLQLSAVGFHRLYVNPLATEIATKLNLFIYAYTVNRPGAAHLLEKQGINGIVTDNPEKMYRGAPGRD